MTQEIEFPQEVQASVENNILQCKGPKGELSREFRSKKIIVTVQDGLVKLVAHNATKREKTLMNTFRAHVRNMVIGVTTGHHYTLKICSGHFPMNVTLKGNEFTVKNFLGEKVPRTTIIKDGAKVKIEGEIVTVDGIDIEIVGQCTANIEQLTRITSKDRRIFQDGIWITSKPGKL